MKNPMNSVAFRFAITCVAPLLLLVVVAFSVSHRIEFLVDTRASMAVGREVEQRLIKVDHLLELMETSARSYQRTGLPEFIETFHARQAQLDEALLQLKPVLAEQPEQLARLDELHALASGWVLPERAAEPGLALVPSLHRVAERREAAAPGAAMGETLSRLQGLHAKLSTLMAAQKQQLTKQRSDFVFQGRQVRLELIGGSVTILFVSLLVVVLMSFGMSRRLKRLASAADQLADGHLDIALTVVQEDEIGAMARAFNHMVARLTHMEKVVKAAADGDFSRQLQVLGDHDRLALGFNEMSDNLQQLALDAQAQNWRRIGVAQLYDEMRNEHALVPLTRKVITFLGQYLKLQVGVFYLAEGESLQLVSSYAYKQRRNNDSSLRFGEGMVGQAALEQETILYSRVPDEQNPLSIHFGLDETQAADVAVIPLVHEGQVEGVLALGSNRTFTVAELELLRRVSESVAISVHVARTQERMALLLEETRQQSEELQSQQEELKAANEELEEQAEMLQRSEQALRLQSEELQQLNTELEERTEALEEQKAEIEQKNRAIQQAHHGLTQQAENLSRASQYKSEFLANMSHELRTPLNSLLILSQSLASNREGNLTAEQQEDAQVIYSGGKTLLTLINDILDLSKVEAGRLDIHAETFELDPLLHGLQSQFNPVAQSKGLTLTLTREATVPECLHSDALRLEQVLRNLLANALKFTDQGEVSLRLFQPAAGSLPAHSALGEQPLLALAVRDTGIGIPEEQQAVIFEAFKQADGSTTRTYGGTGLGLTISRELVRLLGGELHVESRVGEGSTFTVYLPLTQAEASAPEAEAAQPASPPPASASVPASQPVAAPSGEPSLPAERGQTEPSARPGSADGKSLLIIEDDLIFARVLGNLAQQKGYLPLLAHQGHKGLQLAREHVPSGIILDLGLPDMDGRQVLEWLKTDVQTRHIPVHILSAQDKNNEVLGMGAVGFLTKPASAEQMDQVFGRLSLLLQDEPKRVLLIEDDPHNRLAISRLIKNPEVVICEEGRGEAAYQRLLNEHFDCVILDLSLPDISGFELLARLRRQTELTLPPVVVYTGRELTQEEFKQLNEYTSSIVIKGASSPERLLDEVTLFLHSVESSLPAEQRSIIQMLHNPELLLQGRRILLVDDDLRNTYALSRALRERGMEVIMADNGELALERLAQDPTLELVLMDIMMPVMDGYETMRRIRAQPCFQSLPIIALTAKAMAEDRGKCIEAGANDYCTKPVDVDQLIGMMKLWLFK